MCDKYEEDNDDLAIEAKRIPEKVSGMDKKKEEKYLEHRING